MRIKVSKRETISPTYRYLSPVIAVVLALLFGMVVLYITGFNPFTVYRAMWHGAFGSLYGLSETMVKAIPLMLCALGVGLAFRMLMWNIGAEGQLYMGAIGATWVALTLPDSSAYILIPLMIVAGMVLGGLWALLSAIPRAFLGVNEIITSLMLNHVAISIMEYLIHGPWKDPHGFGFPLTPVFSSAARLPTIGDSRVHYGLVLAFVAAIILFFVLKKTKWGYEVRVIGESPAVARYAGMNMARNIIIVMFISGALAGLAGMTEVSAIAGRLQRGLSPGYGYSAIIIAWLGKLNPVTIIVVSILFGALLVGGFSAQFIGVPAASVNMLQGSMLFFLLAAEFLGRYQFQLVPKKEAQSNE